MPRKTPSRSDPSRQGGIAEGRCRGAAAEAAVPGSNYPVIRDKKIIAAAEEYAAAKAQLDLLEGRLKELRPLLEAAMAGAPQASAGNRVLVLTAFPALPATPNVTIDKAMIGQVIPGKKGRAAYTQLKVL